jgi:tripartite-type tricarboxylate transporter receptor subunit TctC
MNRISKVWRVTATILVLAGATLQAQAQDAYPSKPIRMIVPWGAGGTSDTPWRIVGPRISEILGQPVVIENRPGAGSTIGAAMVAAAKPDGYTIMGTSNVHVISAHLYKDLTYHALNDFIFVGQIAKTCSALVVHPSVPASTAQEFIAYAKANPGKIDFGSTGNGSGQHLFMSLFASMAGITLNHVPYKNVSQAVAELLAGQIKAQMPGLSLVLPHIKDGRLKGLGVTCAKRSPFMSELPALGEKAAPGFDATLREGLMVPKGVPPEIVRKLEDALRQAMQLPEVQKSIAGTFNEPVFAGPAEFSADLRAEYAKWGKVVKDLGL